MQKTFKRELGWIMMVCLAVVAGLAIFLKSAEALEVLKITFFPATTYSGLAQGADFVAKQTNWGGPPAPTDPMESD